ncbi:hypothetical protein [Thermogymnomonas acidicola]|uniref:hypothetical protein n=1 Tax=Thermogymnomonas acidicola TaxID=399579 RepID=UPI001494377C|nr:hypothetical protein [Thermogymnomonas acidicola]
MCTYRTTQSTHSIRIPGGRSLTTLGGGGGDNIFRDKEELLSAQRCNGGGWISSIDRFVSSVFAEVYRGSNIGILKDDELSDILSRRNSPPVIVDRTRTASREQVLSSPGHLKYRLDISEAEQKVFEWATTTYLERERSEIDEPVTTDVHRLIRFPMSLHGKSGLMVLPVPLDGLEEFDPLVSAVPERFRDGGECRVELPAGFSVWFMGRKFELDAGVHSVDRALGIFLVASGRAKFV